MSLIWEKPRPSLVIAFDADDPSKEMAYWAEMQRSTYRKQGFRYWSAVTILFGLGIVFWIEVLK